MERPTPRAFTPARIVALVFIGLTVLGLTYLRSASGAKSVSVPKGARSSCARTGTTRSRA
jgi:hypothetical protein